MKKYRLSHPQRSVAYPHRPESENQKRRKRFFPLILPPMPPQSIVARSGTKKRNEREKRGQNQTGNHPNNFCYSPKWNGSENDRFLTIISKGGLACSNWLPESFDQALCHRRPRRAKYRSPGSVFPTKILRRARKKTFHMFWLLRPLCLE